MASDGGAPRTVACLECGHLNHEQAHYCDGCGAAIPRPVEDHHPGDDAPLPWYRRGGIVAAVAVGVLLLAAAVWAAVAATGGDDGTDTAASSTTTSTVTPTTADSAVSPTTAPPAPATTPDAPAPAPTSTPTTAALAAPTITSVTPTCNPDLDPDGPCAITVSWQHPGGANGFAIEPEGHTWPNNRVGGEVRSFRVDGLPTGEEWCVRVIAFVGSRSTSSSPVCASTGIG